MLADAPAFVAAAAPAIAFCASWGLFVPVALVLASIVNRAHRREAIVEATCGGLATVILVKIAGLVYTHPRPFVVHHMAPLVAHVADNGFPSDHSAAAGLAVAFLWARSRPSAIIALVFALLVGAARIAVQLHWPIDVIAGYSFGIIGGSVAFFIFQRLDSGQAGRRNVHSYNDVRRNSA